MIIFSAATGEIKKSIDLPDFLVDANIAACGPGHSALPGSADDAIEMINVNTLQKVARPVLSVTHNGLIHPVGELLRINGVPAGARVTVVGTTTVVNDGFVEWTSMVAGTFPIVIEKFPYQTVLLNVAFT